MSHPTTALLTAVPPSPDADTARRMLRDELADPIYSQEPSLLQRGIEWLLTQLSELRVDGLGITPGAAGLVITVVALGAVLLALYLVGPLRRARRRTAPGAVLGDDARSADEIRADADRHAAAERWAEATLDRFRAVLRSLEERTVLDERPGRTAHEAAEEAGVAFPGLAPRITEAAGTFDDVCYGDLPATRDHHEQVRELDVALSGSSPERAPVASGARS